MTPVVNTVISGIVRITSFRAGSLSYISFGKIADVTLLVLKIFMSAVYTPERPATIIAREVKTTGSSSSKTGKIIQKNISSHLYTKKRKTPSWFLVIGVNSSTCRTNHCVTAISFSSI
jgi:hypothetical protein